jgi:fibronectin type 3 domain-containing protein
VLYQNQSNLLNRAIYVALMGDPSLRQDIIAPISNLSAIAGPGSVTLNWSPSADAVIGYNVYRSTSSSGPFARVNANLITGTTYTDAGLSANSYTYMVRAVAIQTTPSGTYFNPSQGIFATTTVSGSVPPIWVSVARPTNNSLTLTWSSQTGFGYHVQYKDSFMQTFWSNLSATITGTGTTASFTDTNITLHPPRLYRVASP